MKLQESGEMYLETIYILGKKRSGVRAIDVGEYMGFSKPSVSRAMALLKKGGYVTVSDAGFLTLTETGLDVARRTYERHELLTRLFRDMGVSAETAEEDACRIEHVISQETFEAIKNALSRASAEEDRE